MPLFLRIPWWVLSRLTVFTLAAALTLGVLGRVAWDWQQSEMVTSCGQVTGGGDAMVARGSEIAEKLGKAFHQLEDPNFKWDPTAFIESWGRTFSEVVWHAWLEQFLRTANGAKVDPQILKVRENAARQAKQAEDACTPCPTGGDVPDPPNAGPPLDNVVRTVVASTATGRAAVVAAASKYWQGADLRIAVAVSRAESGWDPTIRSKPNTDGTYDHGAWQINSVHRDLLDQGDWRNVDFNAWMAYQVWLDANRSWTPWTTFKSGAYRQYLQGSIGAGERPGPAPADPNTQAATCSADGTAPPPPATGTPSGSWSVKDPTSGTTYSIPIPTDERRRTALRFALDQLGEPYVWAGHGPDVWDCSGLVSGAWHAAGVDFTPQTVVMGGELSDTDEMLPGNLTWISSHVQMIAGRTSDGALLVVEAARPGTDVMIRPQWMQATRVLDPTRKAQPA